MEKKDEFLDFDSKKDNQQNNTDIENTNKEDQNNTDIKNTKKEAKVSGRAIMISLLLVGIVITSFFIFTDKDFNNSNPKNEVNLSQSNEMTTELNSNASNANGTKEKNSSTSGLTAGTEKSLDTKGEDNSQINDETQKEVTFNSNNETQKEVTINSNNETQKEVTIHSNEESTVDISKKSQTPTKVKGIYVTAPIANKNIDDLITMVEETEINTMVIDVKDDQGRITYKMDYEEAKKINATTAYISDMEGLIKKLKEKDIYLIARVVAFKDPILAENRPDLALKKTDGTIFRDKDGLAWVNPYKKEVWDYLVGVAANCSDIGFDEVNFDYIRFSTDKGMSMVNFGEEAKQKTKIETITEFVTYAYKKLKPLGLYVSADVYGAIINSSVDAKIVGQNYVEMAKNLDYICPMIYPSHYGNGYYGIDYPDTKPYELILGALNSSKEVLSTIPKKEHRAIVRPWLQDFTASWLEHYINYGKEEVRDQINAVYDSGYEEWLLWNGRVKYTETAFMTEEEAAEALKSTEKPLSNEED